MANVRPLTSQSTGLKVEQGTDVRVSRLFTSDVVDGASAVAYDYNTLNTLASAGAKLVKWSNNGTEIASIDKDGLLSLATPLGATNGGTGQSTYASGDVLYASGVNVLAKLAKGTDGQILTLVSGLPAWAAPPDAGEWNDNAGSPSYLSTKDVGRAVVVGQQMAPNPNIIFQVTGAVNIQDSSKSGVLARTLRIAGASHTDLPANTDVNSILIDIGQTKSWSSLSTGWAEQNEIYITQPVYYCTEEIDIVNASTLTLQGPPILSLIGGNLLNFQYAWALRIKSGSISLSGAGRVQNALDPVLAQDYVTKAYGDANYLAAGGEWSDQTTYLRTLDAGRAVVVGQQTAPDTGVIFQVTGSTKFTQAAGTGNPIPAVRVVGGAHTALNIGAENIGLDLDFSATKAWTPGSLNTQRELLIRAPNYNIGANTLGTAATLAITGAPGITGGGTVANPLALWVQADRAKFDGTVTVGNVDPPGTESLTVFFKSAIRSPTGGLATLNFYGDTTLKGNINVDTGTGVLALDASQVEFRIAASPIIRATGLGATVRGPASAPLPTQTHGFIVFSPEGAAFRVMGNGLSSSTTEQIDAYIDLSGRTLGALDSYTDQRSTVFGAPTVVGLGGARTIVNAVNVEIMGAPVEGASVMLTNRYALRVLKNAQGYGVARFDDTVRLNPQASDPSALSDGDLWYNSTINKFRKRENGITTNVEVSPQRTTTTAVDLSKGNTQYLQLANGNNTFSFSNPTAGGVYRLILKQPSSGAAGTATWPASIYWTSGVAPRLSQTNNRLDVITLVYDGTNAVYLAYQTSSLTSASSTSVQDFFGVTTDWIVPAGVTSVQIDAIGAGGGGGGALESVTGGGGGGGGGYAKLNSLTVIPGTKISIVAGTGGTAGADHASTPTAGGVGGNSSASYQGVVICRANGGAGGAAGTAGGVGGSGGAGAVGSSFFTGGSGSTGTGGFSTQGGGGAAGSTANGSNASGNTGGVGGAGNPAGGAGGTTSNGTQPGGGGSGGNPDSGSNLNYAGAVGLVRITWTTSTEYLSIPASGRKQSVKCSTVSSLPAATYNNGSDGFGATLTADSNGAISSQDGITLVIGDRLLVKNQSNQAHNGIYSLLQLGDGSTPWILVRTIDADISPNLIPSTEVAVQEGTANKDSVWHLTTDGPITIGTTNLVFAAAYQINGGELTKVVTVTNAMSPYSASWGETLLCDTSGGAITLNLPTAGSGNSGKKIEVKKKTSDGNSVTSDGNGAETIDGSLTDVLTTFNASRTYRSDGSNVYII